MTAKQTAKHITDNAAKILTPTSGSSLDAAEPTPDGLGAWQGGIAHRSLDGAKAKPQRTGDTKNRPGIDYASKINETHQKGYVAPLKIEESDNVPCSDSLDTCLVCGKEVPPGPDFCGEVCEAFAASVDKNKELLEKLNDATPTT